MTGRAVLELMTTYLRSYHFGATDHLLVSVHERDVAVVRHFRGGRKIHSNSRINVGLE